MLKRNWALIALVYLAFAEVASLGPVPNLSLCLMQPEHSEQTTDNNKPKYCPAFHTGVKVLFAATNDAFERYEKLIIGGFTIVLAVSTIGLWLATNKLWEAGERQLKHLGETAAMELRAYVSVENGANTLQFKATRFEFRPVVVNNGTTPAGNVTIASNLGLVSPIIPTNFDYELSKPTDGSVATLAAHKDKFHQVVFHRKATRAELRLIKKGELIFHLYGTVFYSDIFNIERRTNFSFRIMVFGKRAAPFWGATERNNNTT
jgi:hypothetical protein